ncbi:hypothetical protein H7I41_16805 [Mycobacterium manitobense]|uniref:Uncharacterized protein n=1 Tax=[Mycobacterium] manitobense TaxID=190147 RepID=A0A9X2YQL4_9MYCO|nr:hypothetical protein [[Mycobacterium] manitobense]MCV7171576.1 hypothetical protein [[Mycobacterium] manitobense]
MKAAAKALAAMVANPNLFGEADEGGGEGAGGDGGESELVHGLASFLVFLVVV